MDDERNMAWLFRESLGTTYDVQAVLSGEEALSVLEAEPADIVMLDLKLPGADGIEVLKEVKRRWPEIPVIMMTAYATVRTAVLAVKAGAYDYITKPFDMEEIQMLIENALTYSRLDRQADASRLEVQGESPFGD
ncbi:MAG: response regulator, partial [Thermoleophilia bacterium]|nr:response regulator [Thermoleophilia bacterium]